MRQSLRQSLTLAAASILLMLSRPAGAADGDEARLIGSWRLLSYKLEVVGDDSPPRLIFGEHPIGRIVFTPEHTMVVFISGSDRKPLSGSADAPGLLASMLAYTGRYHVEEDKFITDVDGSWNEITHGTQQVRFFSLDGDHLKIRTAEAPSAVVPGKRAVVTLIWKRER